MKRLSCEHLTGRLRAICEGSEDDGTPIEMTPEKRLAYLRKVFCDESEETIVAHLQNQEPGVKRRGLGDFVAAGIKLATFGLVKPCAPCQRRQEMLNDVRLRDIIPFLSPRPITEDTPRNLIMHVWPTNNGAWQWNLDQLIRRRHLFTGKVVLGVATGPNTVSENEVREYARDLDPKIIRVDNNPRIREGATFQHLLESVGTDKDSITFFCHSKGARHGDSFGNDGSTIHQWTEAMYLSCLDQLDAVLDQLASFSMTGPFRRFGNFKTPGNHRWHYSGAFYWFRNADVFERNWQKMDRLFFAVESWPGLMFRPEEVACCLADDCGDLYKMEYWKSEIQPQLDSLMEKIR